MTILLLLTGCDSALDLVGSLGELQAIQGAIAKAIDHSNVRVNLHNNRYLNIGIVNSPLSDGG